MLLLALAAATGGVPAHRGMGAKVAHAILLGHTFGAMQNGTFLLAGVRDLGKGRSRAQLFVVYGGEVVECELRLRDGFVSVARKGEGFGRGRARAGTLADAIQTLRARHRWWPYRLREAVPPSPCVGQGCTMQWYTAGAAAGVRPFGVCLTPKVGSSALKSWLIWSTHPTDMLCRGFLPFWLQTDVRSARCAGLTTCVDPRNGTNSWLPRRRPQGGCQWGVFQHFPYDRARLNPAIAPAAGDEGRRRAVLLRDPWRRFMSGFVSKYTGVCGGNPQCFAKRYFPHFRAASVGRDVGRGFAEYARVVVATPDAAVEQHWKGFAAGCLKWDYAPHLVADIDNATDVDRLSRELLGPGAPAYSEVMRGAYNYTGYCWLGCRQHTSAIIRAVESRYAADVRAITAYGRRHMLGFDDAVASCEKYDRVCHGGCREAPQRCTVNFRVPP